MVAFAREIRCELGLNFPQYRARLPGELPELPQRPPSLLERLELLPDFGDKCFVDAQIADVLAAGESEAQLMHGAGFAAALGGHKPRPLDGSPFRGGEAEPTS
jgi:hypothetical protein